MAITSRATLESTVSDYLARPDITAAQLHTFVQLFEADANRRLRVRQMETSNTFTTSSGVATLPTDYITFRSLTWNGDVSRQIEYVHPTYLRASFPSNEDGVPAWFTIEGTSLTVRPYNDTTDAFTLRYYQTLDALDADDATNWLLAAHPDCYHAGCMFEAWKFLMDVEKAALWKMQRDELFREIELLGEKTKGPAVMRPIGTVV
jgi:hypothetical protein